MNKINKILLIASLIAIVGSPALAASTNSSGSKNLTTAITNATKEVDARISTITRLTTMVNGLKKLTEAQKTSLVTNLQWISAELNDLKAKIAGDTDLATVKTDVTHVRNAFRVQALVVPQTSIVAGGNRALNTVATLNTFLSQIKDRVSKLPAGTDTTEIQKLDTNLSEKIETAKTKAQSAIDNVVALKPDLGNKTIFESNKAKLKEARASLKSAISTIKDARKIAGDLRTALKSVSPKKANTEKVAPAENPTNP